MVLGKLLKKQKKKKVKEKLFSHIMFIIKIKIIINIIKIN